MDPELIKAVTHIAGALDFISLMLFFIMLSLCFGDWKK